MDIQAIKKKLKEMEQGKPKRAKWKPTDEHTVRLLPIPGDEDIVHVIKWHYSVDNGRAMACPTTWGDQCPFCDFAKTLRGWKDKNGRDKTEEQRKLDWEMFKKLDAAVKHYAPIALRKEGSTELEGPYLWEMTPKTYQALFKICADDDYNDGHPDGGGLRVLNSLEHGLDVRVSLKKKGEKGNTTNFDLTEVEERKKPSPLIKGDLKAAQAFVERVPALSLIAEPVTTAQAQKVYDAYQASCEAVAPDTDTGSEYGGNRSAEQPASGNKSVEDVVAQLSAMIGD